jgi:hypothetical protein
MSEWGGAVRARRAPHDQPAGAAVPRRARGEARGAGPVTFSTVDTYWWEQLANRDGEPVPASVKERIGWYERQVRRHRRGNYLIEATTIVLAAAIPVAAATGAGVAVAAVLGAAVTILAGLRQLVRAGENWIRSSRTLLALQREVVLWGSGAAAYAGEHPNAILAENVENLVALETTHWGDQRSVRTPTGEPDPARR